MAFSCITTAFPVVCRCCNLEGIHAQMCRDAHFGNSILVWNIFMFQLEQEDVHRMSTHTVL